MRWTPYGVASIGYSERCWMVKSQKISGIVFVHFYVLLVFMCLCAMVGWHFQFGMSRCSEYAFSYLYLHGVCFSWFSMMKPG